MKLLTKLKTILAEEARGGELALLKKEMSFLGDLLMGRPIPTVTDEAERIVRSGRYFAVRPNGSETSGLG